MRPILLLGKDGQVGWELQRSLAPLAPLIALGRHECDLADQSALREIVRNTKPRVIVNAAAYTAVDRAEQEAQVALRVNGEAPGVLGEEARSLDVPLIHYSTDYVFDGEKSAPYVEDDEPNPLSVYGRSKLAGEKAIASSGSKAIVFRTSWVFGETGANFVRTVLRLAAERDTLRVIDDQIGAPTPAALIADVTAHAIASLDRDGRGDGAQIYHLAAAGPVSWYTYACTIVAKAHELGMKLKLPPDAIERIPTEAYPLPAKRPRNSRLDCSRLMQRFALVLPGWQPYLERMLVRITRNSGY